MHNPPYNKVCFAQDPLADGPVIQSASTRALDHGTTLDGVLDMLRGVSNRLTAPVLMFTYYNPIMARGPDVFCAQARDAGASGGADCARIMCTHAGYREEMPSDIITAIAAEVSAGLAAVQPHRGTQACTGMPSGGSCACPRLVDSHGPRLQC